MVLERKRERVRWTKCIYATNAQLALIDPLQLFYSDSGHHLRSGVYKGESGENTSPVIIVGLEERLASRYP